MGLLGRGAGHPGTPGEPGAQQGRPQLARGARQRGGRRAGRGERGQGARPRLCRERHLRRDGRRAAGHRHRTGRARRLHDHALDRAAHRRGDRRPGHPARRGLGKPGDRPRADLRHRRGHQSRPVDLCRVQHPGRGLRRGAHPRHAHLPAGNPGRSAMASRPSRVLLCPYPAHGIRTGWQASGRRGAGQPARGSARSRGATPRNPTRKKALNEEITPASRASHRRRGDGRARRCRVQFEF